MPSAFSLPCQTNFHFAPASTMPGIAVMVTSLAGGGCGNVLGCATSGPSERADTMRNCVVEDMLLLYRVGIALRERRSQKRTQSDNLAGEKERPVERIRKSSRRRVSEIPYERDDDDY